MKKYCKQIRKSLMYYRIHIVNPYKHHHLQYPLGVRFEGPNLKLFT